jgi:NAD+ kinase
MAVIGLVLHGQDPEAAVEAERLAETLIADGHEVVGIAGDVPDHSAVTPRSEADFADGLDLAVSLGGDGTMLRTVGLLRGSEVGILGVNFGDLGYLTVIEPDDLHPAINRALAGDHDCEERMLARGTVEGRSLDAFNDIVVERAPGDTTVRIGVSIDGKRFTSYPADGLILSTPTGSTAYAFSARGPIVDPNHDCLQLTPVSPHMLFDRSLILSPDSVIELTVEGHRPAVVSVDGRTMHTMEPGDTLRCSRSPHVARLITFDDRDHLAVLKSKLGLADR